MAKTIKVIDLLNKIANGEEVPERIKYGTKTWKLRENKNLDNDYINEDLDISTKLFDEYLDGILLECLNDTVEIIEEQQDIDIDKLEEYTKDELEYMCPEELKPLAYKCNEIIRAVKQLDRNIKDKE